MIQKKEPKAPFIIIVCLDYNLKPTLIIPVTPPSSPQEVISSPEETPKP